MTPRSGRRDPLACFGRFTLLFIGVLCGKWVCGKLLGPRNAWGLTIGVVLGLALIVCLMPPHRS